MFFNTMFVGDPWAVFLASNPPVWKHWQKSTAGLKPEHRTSNNGVTQGMPGPYTCRGLASLSGNMPAQETCHLREHAIVHKERDHGDHRPGVWGRGMYVPW